MKNLMITLCLVAWVSLSCWAQTNYVQFECGYMRAKSGHSDMFKKGLTAHNQKYHNVDPYKIYVWEVLTGPNSGTYFTALGPVSFTQLDKRPDSPEHNADWQNNVEVHMDYVGESSYWRRDTTLNYTPAGSDDFGKSRIRYVTLNPDESDRWEEQQEKVIEVFKAKNYPAAYAVYTRYGLSAGPTACSEINFKDWAFLDSPNNFIKDFDEVHGVGAYERWLEEITISVDRTKTYDELISFIPELSSK